MKHRLFSRSIALLVVFGLLLTGSILPVSATANSEVVDSSSNLILDDALIKDDNLINSEKAILRAEDPAISKESMILKYIDSSQFNAAKHVQRLTELEDLNTYVFANADGTRSIYMMHENVKYVDKDGKVKEKDISLKSKTGGFGIVQSNVGLLIPNNPVQGIDLEYSGFAIKLIPQGLTNAVSAMQSENSVVYDNAYGQNTKLVYTPMLSGVKEDIVLTEYTANATYSFILETDGLFVYNGHGSYYLADDGKAEPIFYLGEILIYDAVGKPAVGTLTVETVTAGEKYLLTVTADDDFLSDPTTVYPVTIDPSITVSDSTTTGSILDAPIFEGYPAKNFGTYVYNCVGTPSDAYGIGRTVVKLSGLTSSNEYQTITANQITNVTFYAKEASGGITQYINLYPLTSNTTWTESTVTWNNVGSYNTSVNYGNTMYNNRWTAFNITDLVKGWKNETYSADAGFIMTNENEANNKSFCASEYSTASYRPYVIMTYEPTFCGGDSFDDAEVVSLNTTYLVNIASAYEKKYFEFTPSTTGVYSFISSTSAGDPYARLYNSSEQQIHYDDDSAGNRNFCLSYHLMAGISYYFEASCFSNGTCSYEFRVSNANASSKIDCTTMTLGENRSINITIPHKIVCYKVTPTETKEYLFFSSNKTGAPEIWVYNSSFGYVTDNDDGAGGLNFRLTITLNAGTTYYIVLRHNYSSVGSFGFNSFYDADIPYGSYYLKNTGSLGYMDIDDPGAQEWVHQWSKHTGLQEKWRIDQDSNGYYTIRSEHGAKKYVGISSTSTAEDNIKLYSSISDSTRWKIYKNASNALIVIPKSATTKVLCAPDDTVGTQLRLRAIYDLSTPNRSNWMLNSYSLSINTFYDNAFNVRYGNGASLVSSFSDEISRILRGTVGLEVTMNAPTMILSTPDHCKLQRGFDITSTTINTKSYAICPSNPSVEENCPYYVLNKVGHSDCENCTSCYQAYRDFIREFPGNETTASILFTGSRLYDDQGNECNRSFRWYSNGIILQEIWGSSSSYASIELPCVLHEISHEIGAPDHYHEMITNDLGQRVCRGGSMCFECNPATGRPKWCTMGDDGGWRTDLGTCDMDEVYCEGCRNQIIEHLIGHHFD